MESITDSVKDPITTGLTKTNTKRKRGRPRVIQNNDLPERRREQMKKAQRAYRLRKETQAESDHKRVQLLEEKLREIQEDFAEFYDEGINICSNFTTTNLRLDSEYLCELFVKYGSRIAKHLKECKQQINKKKKTSEDIDIDVTNDDDFESAPEAEHEPLINQNQKQNGKLVLHRPQIPNINDILHNGDKLIFKISTTNYNDIQSSTLNFKDNININTMKMISDNNLRSPNNVLQIYQGPDKSNPKFNNHSSITTNHDPLYIYCTSLITDFLTDDIRTYPYWLSNIYIPNLTPNPGYKYKNPKDSSFNHKHINNKALNSENFLNLSKNLIKKISSLLYPLNNFKFFSKRLLLLTLIDVIKKYLNNDLYTLSLKFPEGYNEDYIIPKVLFAVEYSLKFTDRPWTDNKAPKPDFYDDNLAQDDELVGYICAKSVEELFRKNHLLNDYDDKNTINNKLIDENLLVYPLLVSAVCYKWTPLYRRDVVEAVIKSKSDYIAKG